MSTKKAVASDNAHKDDVRRDALAWVGVVNDAPSLAAIREALEEALGVRFEGEKVVRFFQSTLVHILAVLQSLTRQPSVDMVTHIS